MASTRAWVVLGDFNVLLSVQDKNGPTVNINNILRFREVVQEMGLVDLPILNRSFTWSNGRGVPTLERLDRVFISNAWVLVFPRFESYWLRHQAVLEVVTQAWNSSVPEADPVKLFSRKLESVQVALRLWSAGLSLASKEQAKRCLLWIEWLDRAEERRLLSIPEYILRPKLKARYEELCLQEEIKWKQRSRIQWLKVGDAKTKFFHQKVKARRNKNFISRLSNGSTTLSSPEPIAEHLFSFFRNQLGVQHVPSVDINLQALYEDEQVDLSSLHAPFTLAEVRTIVFSSALEKAPGPDGLPMIFYQHFWSLLKDDIMGVFNSFYTGTTNFDRVNTGWLCLIPKKKEAFSANDFRPISLVHSVAKLISKVLASRLQLFLGGLINPHQAAFIKGRHIIDNFFCAHILIHHLHTTKHRAAFLKIDFERAFDRVNWSFLLDLLQARGFSPRWNSWIRTLLHTASMSVILNGTPGNSFSYFYRALPLPGYCRILESIMLGCTLYNLRTT
uniref:Reverse transcriptase domain-containing protein n=1 Tax=Ananas comosus var. bracteatus TaxID=296719 RepID=A0A6V7QQE7_ANACO